MSREIPAVQHHVHRIMSREIVRENSVMLLLGNAQAEERLAAFFVNWGQRLQARGFSATELVLRMTRQDLGNYLGLKIETVSRTLTKLAGRGILSVAGREIHILDMAAFRAVASGADAQ
jgi:CRP/FNR family transcriptional regulator